MKFFRELLAFVFILAVAKSAISENNAEDDYFNDPEWWKTAPPKKNAVPIGGNVTLYAHVTYDSAYEAQKTKEVERQSSNQGGSTEIQLYFNALFEKVQTYFRNHSIIINVVVSSVSKNDNLSVHHPTFDVEKTLEHVKTYGTSLNKPNNTIFYHFTWTTTTFVAYNFAKDFATTGTFCAQNTSAAVIRNKYGSRVYWKTVNATARIFNSDHFLAITDDDRKKMNETFSRCPDPTKEKQNGEVPAYLVC